MTITIRPATREDCPLIMQLIRDLAAYEKMSDQVRASEADLERNLFGSPFGRGPVAEAIVGEVDGAPQGFALFFHNYSTFVGKPGIWLEDLFVRPEARGKGLGAALLAQLAALARERGCGRVEWAVLDWNAPAIGFYERLGAHLLTDWRVCRLTGEALEELAAARA